jgi:hypothetical protein
VSGSSDNAIYCNNFIGNSQQVTSDGSPNAWDNGSKGNYWSDYATRYPNASETDSSGVWNTPYVIDSNNIDRYPLKTQYIVPELPSFWFLLLLLTATLLVARVSKRKTSGS